MKDKVNVDKVDQATELLRQMMEVAGKFDEIFKTLTLQEKYLVGGVVFRIRFIYHLVGIMADRNIANEMINTLVGFYQNPEAFGGKKIEVEPSIIRPADDIKH